MCHLMFDFMYFLQVRSIRNNLMHSADFAVTTPDMKTHIHAMITLLQEPAVWAYQCARDAIGDLRDVLRIYLYSFLQMQRCM